MKRKKLNKKFIIVILILFISIGFAYLTTNLGINGISIIKKTVWDVHFENIINENEDVLSIDAPAVISNNKLRVDFEVTLDQPGQEYSFYVDVINNSTFDVMIDTVTISGLTTAQEKWISPKVTYSDGISLQQYDVLKESSKEVLRVSVKYLDDLTSSELPTSDNDFTMTLEITYNQADENVKERNHLVYVHRNTPGVISVGDEIAIDTEHFYVVSSDEEKTVLLAKYNLNVGNYIQEGVVGIQNENAIGNGGAYSGNYFASTVAFSNQNYWYENGLKPKYGTSFTNNNVYDESYANETGNNYSVAYYNKEYKNILSEMGLNVIKARLLLYDEAIALGCNVERRTCLLSGLDFFKMTTFWLGTANSSNEMWYIDQRAYFYIITSMNDHDLGVRPVIEIPTSNLNINYTITFNYNYEGASEPLLVTKQINEDILSNYSIQRSIDKNSARSEHYFTNMTYNIIDDKYTTTGNAIEIKRIAAGTTTSGVYYGSGTIIIGEPYELDYRIKGKGRWTIGHEQGSLLTEEISNTYKIYKRKYKAANTQYKAIVFYANSLNAGTYINIDYAKLYHRLPDASRTGYTFAGWYTDPIEGTRINESILVRSDATYYAHWTENS